MNGREELGKAQADRRPRPSVERFLTEIAPHCLACFMLKKILPQVSLRYFSTLQAKQR